MKSPVSKVALFLLSLVLAVSGASAAVTLVEPGHTLVKIVDSTSPSHPSQIDLDFACEFIPDSYDIESIAVDEATGRLWVQLEWPAGAFQSTSTCIFEVTGGVVTLVNPNTGFGINGRGTDMHFDPATGLLITQDQNTGPLKRIATQVPAFLGPTGTHCFVTPSVFDGAGSFGGGFSTGVGGSDVPAGDLVFTTDTSGNGIHSCTFGGGGTTAHALGGPALLPGDDMVIQPDGDWIHIGDFTRPITRYLPSAGHAAFPSALDIETIFDDAGRPFVHGSRATVCDITGDTYVSYSGSPGGSAIFRIDEGLTTATHVLDIGGDEGLHDLTLGRSSSGAGESVYFTVHDSLSFGEEVWELTVPECACNADPRSQGYWHRQCLGVPASEGGIDPGRNGRGPSSPTEPNFVPDLMECAFDGLEDMGFFGVTTCEGMDANPPSDPCERAEKQTTALILNVCSGKLAHGCEVDVSAQGCSSTTVAGLMDELAGLIMGGDCQQAADCAAAINEGTGVVTPAPIQASFDKSGVPDILVKTTSNPVTPESNQPVFRSSVASSGSTVATPTEQTEYETLHLDASTPTSIAVIENSADSTEGRDTHPRSQARTPEDHLEILTTSGASLEDRKAAEDALFDALGGGYEPALRMEIVEGLFSEVDVALHSLLAKHLMDIQEEARELGDKALVRKAKRLLKKLESKK